MRWLCVTICINIFIYSLKVLKQKIFKMRPVQNSRGVATAVLAVSKIWGPGLQGFSLDEKILLEGPLNTLWYSAHLGQATPLQNRLNYRRLKQRDQGTFYLTKHLITYKLYYTIFHSSKLRLWRRERAFPRHFLAHWLQLVQLVVYLSPNIILFFHWYSFSKKKTQKKMLYVLLLPA